MTNKELLEFARNWTPTEEDMKKVREQLEESCRKIEEQSKRSSSQEFLNRTYSL